MKELKFLLCLGVLGLLALACSGPEDTGGGDTVDVFGVHIPDEILSSFKGLSGGSLENIGVNVPNDEDGVIYIGNEQTLIDIQEEFNDSSTHPYALEETGDGQGDSVYVKSFAIMDTEVTIQMYVDFLNRIAATQTSEGDSATTLSFSDVTSLYKPVMQDIGNCGIYPRDANGTRISDPYDTYSGFYVSTASAKPSENIEYSDPNHEYQKPRSATAGTISKFGIEPGRRNFPVVFVSQADAKEFCQWLGPNYRLPTWQEWSYAAKGGKSDANFATSTGNILLRSGPSFVRTNTNDYVYLANILGPHTTPVGAREVSKLSEHGFPPNAYGLYDMTGNVYEWTYFREEDQTENGATIPYGGQKFYMGGSFATQFFTAASNWYRTTGLLGENGWASDLGFRVVFDKSRALTVGEYSGIIY